MALNNFSNTNFTSKNLKGHISASKKGWMLGFFMSFVSEESVGNIFNVCLLDSFRDNFFDFVNTDFTRTS